MGLRAHKMDLKTLMPNYGLRAIVGHFFKDQNDAAEFTTLIGI